MKDNSLLQSILQSDSCKNKDYSRMAGQIMNFFSKNLQKTLAKSEQLLYYSNVGERKDLRSCKSNGFTRILVYIFVYYFKEDIYHVIC